VTKLAISGQLLVVASLGQSLMAAVMCRRRWRVRGEHSFVAWRRAQLTSMTDRRAGASTAWL